MINERQCLLQAASPAARPGVRRAAKDTPGRSQWLGQGAAVDESAIEGLKFSECLPRDLALQMLEQRLSDPDAVRSVLESQVRLVSV